MKSKYSGLSLMSLAVSAVFVGCSQEEIASTQQPESDKALTVTVSAQDFVPEEGSRAVTNDDETRTTTFASGDNMGIYAFSADGEVLYNNVQFTYNGENWTGTQDLYLYRNATYVAYYPYNAELGNETIASEDAIKNYFTTNFSYEQNTADLYEAADLMMAEAEPDDEGNLNFSLGHQFAMIEINVPVRHYRTSGGFDYYAPFKMQWNGESNIAEGPSVGENVVKPYSVGKGSFRFIMQPGEQTVKIDGTAFYDSDIPVNFDNKEGQNVTLTAGQFKQYNVAYSGVSTEPVTRDLEVGDYYYSDGSIYPYGNQEGDNDLSDPVVENCIGVIFEVGTGAQGTEWNHGSAIALSNASQGKWSGSNSLISSDNAIPNIESEDTYTALKTAKNGYSLSKDPAFASAVVGYIANFGDNAPAPEGASTGWYIPAIGQLFELATNFGATINSGNDIIGERALNFNDSGLGTAMTRVGGEWRPSGGMRVFSITEVDANNAWALSSDKPGIVSTSKTNGNAQYKIRPILSF